LKLEDLYATPLAFAKSPTLMPAIMPHSAVTFSFGFYHRLLKWLDNTLQSSSRQSGGANASHAIGAVVLIVSMTLLILAQFILRGGRSARRATAR
jgi:hypothetical protein